MKINNMERLITYIRYRIVQSPGLLVYLPVHVAVGARVKLGWGEVEFCVTCCNFRRYMIVAAIAGINLIGAGMTRGAGDFAFTAVIDGESMFPQGRWRPGIGCVAVFTACAKETGVDCGFLVTARTSCSGAAKYIVLVAVSAGNGGVFTGQREGHIVRPTFEAIYTIMAGHTFSAVLGYMLLHKSWIVIAVALNTTGRGDDGGVAGMATVAGDGIARVIHSMQV
jgi:hypothetical protein